MFSKLATSSSSVSGRSGTLHLQPPCSPSPSVMSSPHPNSTANASPTSMPTSSANTDAVETRFFTHSDVKAIEAGEIKLDQILKKFLQCFERYKYDESGIDLFDSFSSMLEFKKHFTDMLSKFPEFSTTSITTDLNKLLALLADRDENVIEPAFHLMSDLHSLLHERIFHLTGRVSCKLEHERDSEAIDFEKITLEEIKRILDENNKSEVKLPVVESILVNSGEKGISKAFESGEMFSKYFRDCLSYVEKKLALDLDYCVKLYKISQGYNFSAVDENYATLPLWGTVSFMNLQDKEYCKKLNEVTMELQNRKFVESLRSRKQEFDDLRKEIKDLWELEERNYANTCLLVRKARDNYWLKQAEVSRLEQSSSESEKRQKQMIEAKDRLLDSKIKYDRLIAVANAGQKSVKDERNTAVICIRQLILQAELKIQSALINYFKMVTGMYQLRPVQYKHLVEQSRSYTVENFYRDQLISILNNDPDLPSQQEEEFKLENCPNLNIKLQESKASRLFSISSSAMSNVISSKSKSTEEGGCGKRASNLSSMLTVPGSAFDSRHTSFSDFTSSDAAKTHNFAEVDRDPSVHFQCTFCVECDVYVFYEALFCKTCSKAIHTGCLNKLSITCFQARDVPQRNMKIFSVPLSLQPIDNAAGVPVVLSKCIKQIENEFLEIRGLYRTEGAKAKVQILCQKFEDSYSSVNLSSTPPQVLCSLVKHFFRVLPHRLLDNNLTEDWQDVGRCYRALKEEDKSYNHLLQKSAKLIGLLSVQNQKVLRFFLRHLRQITEHSSLNKMNAYNLGRVFGPTLITNKKQDEHIFQLGRLDQEISELDHLSAVIEMFIEDYPKLFENVSIQSCSSDPMSKTLTLDETSSTLKYSEPELRGCKSTEATVDITSTEGMHSKATKRSLQSLAKLHGTVSVENASISPTSNVLEEPPRLNKFESTQSFDPSTEPATSPTNEEPRRVGASEDSELRLLTKTIVVRSSSSTPNMEKS